MVRLLLFLTRHDLFVRIALNALLRSGYQPSRTLVFSLMLGEVRHHHGYLKSEDLPFLMMFSRNSPPRLLMDLKFLNSSVPRMVT